MTCQECLRICDDFNSSNADFWAAHQHAIGCKPCVDFIKSVIENKISKMSPLELLAASQQAGKKYKERMQAKMTDPEL